MLNYFAIKSRLRDECGSFTSKQWLYLGNQVSYLEIGHGGSDVLVVGLRWFRGDMGEVGRGCFY
jgi:hypothetical protein